MPNPESPAGTDVKLDSSPAPQPDASASPPAAPAAAPAAAAPAGQPEPPKSVLDAVIAGLEKEKKPAAAAPGEEPPAAPAAGAGGEPPASGDEQQPKPGDPPKNANTRIRDLISQVKGLEPKARYFDEMSAWATQNGLDEQDIKYALNLIRLVKNDPAGAHKLLQPLANRVAVAVGEQLPSDLQEKLDKGLISEDDARELARRRAAEGFNGERNRREAAQRERNRVVHDAQQRAGAIGTAVSTWERDWQKNDPDYSKKQKFVSAEIARLMNEEGVPLTPQDALDQAKRALETVEQNMTGILPPRKQLQPAVGGAAPRSSAPPTSSFEAAKKGLEKSHLAA